MTAAQAVASRVGAPLGHDYAVISLSDRLKPWDVITARLDGCGRRRPGARDLQPGLEDAAPGRSARCGTCCSSTATRALQWSSAATCPGPREPVKVVRLADLDPADVDMRCLLIVGSSQTQWQRMDRGDRVFTPRRYPG